MKNPDCSKVPDQINKLSIDLQDSAWKSIFCFSDIDTMIIKWQQHLPFVLFLLDSLRSSHFVDLFAYTGKYNNGSVRQLIYEFSNMEI